MIHRPIKSISPKANRFILVSDKLGGNRLPNQVPQTTIGKPSKTRVKTSLVKSPPAPTKIVRVLVVSMKQANKVERMTAMGKGWR